jgi:hypothetical protein
MMTHNTRDTEDPSVTACGLLHSWRPGACRGLCPCVYHVLMQQDADPIADWSPSATRHVILGVG